MPKPAGQLLTRPVDCTSGSSFRREATRSIRVRLVIVTGCWPGRFSGMREMAVIRRSRAPAGIASLAGRGVSQNPAASARIPVVPLASRTALTSRLI